MRLGPCTNRQTTTSTTDGLSALPLATEGGALNAAKDVSRPPSLVERTSKILNVISVRDLATNPGAHAGTYAPSTAGRAGNPNLELTRFGGHPESRRHERPMGVTDAEPQAAIPARVPL